MTYEQVFQFLGLVVVIAPCMLLAFIGLPALLGWPLNERTIVRSTQTAVVCGLSAATAILALMLIVGTRHVTVQTAEWVVIPLHHFHFTIKFVFDRLSVPFVILTLVLCGTIAAFANSYLHREPGFGRFFVSFALFLLGMIISSLAGTIETLFTGWELVGLSSALLVAFFHDRAQPVRNGMRVWTVYRVADAAFVIAAVALHHVTGEGDFVGLMGAGPWPEGRATLSSNQALFLGALLLVAAAGKSALIPFSGWLPRAMEGPTPSSAVFYGALSVHLGAFLLLRVSPVLELSQPLCIAIIVLGLLTSLFAAMSARVQTDIKSALCFASLTQIGLIVAEIGFGLRYVALVHIIGHACLRTLQFLRAPTLLHDYHVLENAIGEHLSRPPSRWKRIIPESARVWLYQFALERGYMDLLLSDYIVEPFLSLFRAFDKWERRWMELLSGKKDVSGDRVPRPINAVEELR